MIQGVRLLCTKEGPPPFRQADIPSNHAIFGSPALEVPAILGIPMVIHRVGTKSSDGADLDCQIATYLNIKYSNGLAPPEWQSHVGSCLVARKDQKPLSLPHLEAVWMFISMVLDSYSEDDKEAQTLITRQGFERWFDDYKSGQVMNGRTEWADVGNTYIHRV
ncbi:hypothetical protein LTR15_007981 [Elasticomyces elasticus]|nr:hypothetical protein LTR15_007981 [Elasticomyces elasticus]